MHGSMSAYQDRALIQGVKVSLSRQSYLNCGPGRNSSHGCNGGEPADVFQYMRDVGIPDESCLPYNATDNRKWCSPEDYDSDGECYKECPGEGECMNCMYIQGAIPPHTECWAVPSFTKYRAKKWGHVKGELAMMKEIYNHGPITCGISCPEDFTYGYRAGVLQDTSGDRDIDHDIGKYYLRPPCCYDKIMYLLLLMQRLSAGALTRMALNTGIFATAGGPTGVKMAWLKLFAALTAKR